MITACGDAETKRKALENAAEALLTKPIDSAARSICALNAPHNVREFAAVHESAHVHLPKCDFAPCPPCGRYRVQSGRRMTSDKSEGGFRPTNLVGESNSLAGKIGSRYISF
jgi:hypothetical protein